MDYRYNFVWFIALLLLCGTASARSQRGVGGGQPKSSSVGDEATATNARAVAVKPAKRDLSLSYSATDIDSKQGSRVKMITVIKNIGNSEKLVINPELHKSEEWGSLFRDNFEAYASIPDVPDVDDLFEFVKKKQPEVKSNSSSRASGADKTTKTTTAPANKTPPPLPPKKPTPALEKPVKEESEDLEPPPVKEQANDSASPVEKIKGDAELIPFGSGRRSNSSSSGGGLRSQSLHYHPHPRSQQVREALVSLNHSTPQREAQQHHENYVHENTNGYDYPQPCARQPAANGGSVTVTTPSGRTYDIPLGNINHNNNNNNNGNPYIAPGVSKKPTIQTPLPLPPANTQTAYSVNSILPPLQSNSQPVAAFPASNNINNNQQQQRPAQTQNGQPNGFSTSQRPYVAPNVLNGGGGGIVAINRQPAAAARPNYASSSGGPKHFRTNVFGPGANRPNTARSRGLKY